MRSQKFLVRSDTQDMVFLNATEKKQHSSYHKSRRQCEHEPNRDFALFRELDEREIALLTSSSRRSVNEEICCDQETISEIWQNIYKDERKSQDCAADSFPCHLDQERSFCETYWRRVDEMNSAAIAKKRNDLIDNRRQLMPDSLDTHSDWEITSSMKRICCVENRFDAGLNVGSDCYCLRSHKSDIDLPGMGENHELFKFYRISSHNSTEYSITRRNAYSSNLNEKCKRMTTLREFNCQRCFRKWHSYKTFPYKSQKCNKCDNIVFPDNFTPDEAINSIPFRKNRRFTHFQDQRAVKLSERNFF
ncbi:MAG: hypothetical protein MHMPM18_000204 [Marteilia pararefringens]